MFVFDFDKVYTEEESQKEVYEDTFKSVFKNTIVKAKSSTILLFGPSGCGKTYTIIGKSRMGRGILHRGVEEIFTSLKSLSRFPGEFAIFLSVCLMHKKRAVDMLELPDSSKQGYKTVKSSEGLSKVALQNSYDLSNAIKKIYRQLTRMSTEWGEEKLEETAHIAFTLEIMRRESNDIEEVLYEQDNFRKYAKITLVKLAGSEHTGSNAESQKQFATESFNALSNQILQTALHTKTKAKGKNKKLLPGTEVLLKLLQGNASPENRVYVITCVNPRQNKLSETLPALKFVSRMRECICVEMEKRGVKPFYLSPESKMLVPEDNTGVDVLRGDINQMCENYKSNSVLKEDFEIWAEQKEQEVKSLLAKMEDDISSAPNKGESELIEKYEELLLLKNKIGQIRKELITPASPPAPIRSSQYRSQSDYPAAEKELSPQQVRKSPAGAVKRSSSPIPDEGNAAGSPSDKRSDRSAPKARDEVSEQRIRELEKQIEELRSHAMASNEYFDQVIKSKLSPKENDNLTKLAKENEAFKAQIKEIAEGREKAKGKLAEYKKELDDTREELEQEKSRKRHLESSRKFQSFETEKPQSEEVESLRVQIETMKAIIEENRITVEKVRKDRERMIKEVQELEQVHAEPLRKKDQEMDDMRQVFTAKLRNLQEELDRSRYETSEEVEKYKEENRKLKEENIELMNKTSNLSENNEKLRQELTITTKTNEKELLAIEQKCDGLFKELQRLRVENAEFKERERALARKKEEMMKKVKQLEDENKKFKAKKKEYKKGLEEIERKVRELEFEKELANKVNKKKGEITMEAKEYQIKVILFDSKTI